MTRSRLLLAILAVATELMVGPPQAMGQPTVTLAPACHDSLDTYAFDASLSGFPPNTPFDAVLHYSGVDHNFIGFLSTSATGSFGPTRFGDTSPLGDVTATVTATIDGTRQTFTATLKDPCNPPPSLKEAMCGDGSWRTYHFASLGRCHAYIERLQHGTATPELILTPLCGTPSAPFGFDALVLGFPPGTQLDASLTYDSQSFHVGVGVGRFGTVGPVGFTSAQPVGEVSASVTEPGGTTLTETLHNPCVS